MNLFNKKKKEPVSQFGKCYLCGKELAADYCLIAYQTDEFEQVDHAMICSSCADTLEAKDKKTFEVDGVEIEEYDD
jgi:uncharacterized CHY-type Zn-finger protein